MTALTVQKCSTLAALALLAHPVGASAIPARPALPAITPTHLKQFLKKQKGHVVLLNFWATWCGPCVAEFPDLVKIAQSYQSKGLRFVTVSGDQPSDASRADLFIHLHHAKAQSFIKSPGDIVAYAKAFDPHWDGSLPRTYLLDKTGSIRFVFAGRVNDATLKADLAKLLSAQPHPKSKSHK